MTALLLAAAGLLTLGPSTARLGLDASEGKTVKVKVSFTGDDDNPQGAFDPQALLCTDPAADPIQILQWFVLRWQLEVTFQEVRTHLGVETQRQWSDLAIARTTPVLLGLFSWTTLAAHALQKHHPITQRTAAWYDKPSPTFVDAIALVRRHLWLASEGFSLSVADPDTQELPVALYHRLVDSLAYAA